MPTVKRTNDEWRALLTEQRTSGQSQEEWCAANGVNLYTLRDRSSRLRKLDGQGQSAAAPAAATASIQREKRPNPATAGWMEVRPESLPEKVAGISIERDGWMLTVETGFDAELLTEVLRAVNRACC